MSEVMNVHKSLRKEGINFVLLGKKSKKPFQQGWQKKKIGFDDLELIQHLKNGGNYGVMGGGDNKMIIVDFDDENVQKELIDKLPNTFTVKTGSGLLHKYYFSNGSESFKIFAEDMKTLADVQGEGKQVVGPGSVHPNGNSYEIVDDSEIGFIEYSELKAMIMKYNKKKDGRQEGVTEKSKNKFIEKVRSKVSMEDVLRLSNVDVSKNPTECPFHDSKGGKCLSFDSEKAHCFHCDGGWDIFKFVQQLKDWKFGKTLEFLSKVADLEEEYNEEKEKYVKEKKLEKAANIFTMDGQTEFFYKKQPFFYDKSRNFFLWDNEMFKWDMCDEVDILNRIFSITGKDVITSKSRNEIINSLKQKGRLNVPKPIPKSWVQYKGKIYDVKTGDVFDASPEYFVTNPIPWKVGESEDTPIIDNILNEWVGEKYKQTMYEFIAYNTCTDKFMQRLFAFCGGGSNGKGTFIKMNYKFIGEENCVSSEIKALSEDRFEPAILYRKLLCVMGEVSHSDLKNTNQIKKIAGEDKLSFQFKGKTPFTDDNTATGVCLTNSLPNTPDRSLGFYRKFLIIDFPNQFSGIKNDVISTIPDEEFENLARKSIRILKDLYRTREFTNEGTFQERMDRYEERSNPVIKYMDDYYEEVPGNCISLREFSNDCNQHLKSKHLRVMTAIQVGKILRDEGFSVGNRKIDDISSVVVLNIKKTSSPIYNDKNDEKSPKLLELSKLPKSPLDSHVTSTSLLDSSDSSNSFLPQKETNNSKKELKLKKMHDILWEDSENKNSVSSYNPQKVKKIDEKTESDRESQFFTTKECQNIIPKCTKKEVENYIKSNPNYDFKKAYKKLGTGFFKWESELKEEMKNEYEASKPKPMYKDFWDKVTKMKKENKTCRCDFDETDGFDNCIKCFLPIKHPFNFKDYEMNKDVKDYYFWSSPRSDSNRWLCVSNKLYCEMMNYETIQKENVISGYVMMMCAFNGKLWSTMRWFFWNIQDKKCVCCEKHFEEKDMELHHILPKSKGGRESKDNLQMLCKLCHRAKMIELYD
jgi:P4 family phage/plasmid primase-like protien